MATPQEIFKMRTASPGEKIDEVSKVLARLKSGEIDRETAEKEVNFLAEGMSAADLSLIEEGWQAIENNDQKMTA